MHRGNDDDEGRSQYARHSCFDAARGGRADRSRYRNRAEAGCQSRRRLDRGGRGRPYRPVGPGGRAVDRRLQARRLTYAGGRPSGGAPDLPPQAPLRRGLDRKGDVRGKRGEVLVVLGGLLTLKKKKNYITYST